MTRINCIPPRELARQHLIAEYRELPRVFNLVRKAQDKGHKPSDIDVPSTYRLGTGHVKFFYDKLGFLIKRQKLLIKEMQRRGYKPAFGVDDLTKGIDRHWFGDWIPSKSAQKINRERIRVRLEGK